MFLNKILLISGIVFVLTGQICAQSLKEFQFPADSNRVLTYWQWMNGNITKEGITKDLESMKSAGINGTMLFSAGFFPNGPVKFMTEEWWDYLAYTMKESDRLKMKFGIYNSDGWSMSGGPWITPNESMKEITWKDTTIQGGATILTKLPLPKNNLLYKDIAILAFPALTNDLPIPIKETKYSSLIENFEAAFDNDFKTSVYFLKSQDGNLPYITFDFLQQKKFRRLVLSGITCQPFLDAFAKLEYSVDGKKFIEITSDFPLNMKAEGLIDQLTLNFPEISARFLRLTVLFDTTNQTTPVTMSQKSIGFEEISFFETPRINLWEPKSGESKRIRHDRQQVFIKELNSLTQENLTDNYKVKTENIINITNNVDKNGILNWKVPNGTWIIQRIGFTSTNRMVSPATKEGRGLECDKMNAKAVEKHFNGFMTKVIDLSNKIVGRPVDYMQMESWEAGIQNWTEGFEKAFKKQNGYSIISYLPILAGGYVVNSYEESNKFLWDMRNTMAQLIADNYWGTMYKLANAKGVTVSGEGSGMQHYLYDPIRYQEKLDMPMGEFWPNEIHVRADNKSASSVSHTLGRTLTGGEAFTSGEENLWGVKPFDLKQIGDEAFIMGINQFVLHSNVHQPYDIGPGFTLARFGNHFQRLNPWFNHAQGWLNYLARCQYMLRQGKSIQDIAYFSGEGIPSYLGLPWELHPKLPKGFDYDGVNIEILKMMIVKGGKLCLPSGASYELLVFQDLDRMTPALIKEIQRLLFEGTIIVSRKPLDCPSLVYDLLSIKKANKITEEVWGNTEGQQITEHKYGKGKIYFGVTMDEVMKTLKVIPDFVYKTQGDSSIINFVHRQNHNTDIYFLANYQKQYIQAKGIFRTFKKIPELWNPDQGTVKALPYRVLNDKQIEVTLDFDPLGSMFIVFKDAAKGQSSMVTTKTTEETYPVTGPWNVKFKNQTDSLNTIFDELTDWSQDKNKTIKYFSGSATYSKVIMLDIIKSYTVQIGLGNVNYNIAEIIVNGHEVARLWKPPYNIDITPFVLNGKNELKIVVTNTAVNSLIGDDRFTEDISYKNDIVQQFPTWLSHPEKRESDRKTFVTYKYLNKDSKLDPSGLLGPVEIKIGKLKE